MLFYVCGQTLYRIKITLTRNGTALESSKIAVHIYYLSVPNVFYWLDIDHTVNACVFHTYVFFSATRLYQLKRQRSHTVS